MKDKRIPVLQQSDFPARNVKPLLFCLSDVLSFVYRKVRVIDKWIRRIIELRGRVLPLDPARFEQPTKVHEDSQRTFFFFGFSFFSSSSSSSSLLSATFL